MITFRLADSLPQKIITELKAEYEFRISIIEEQNDNKFKEIKDKIAFELFGKYDHQLEKKPYGNCILEDEKIANILYDKILQYHTKLYLLKCFSIMPNHVHIVLSSAGDTPYDELDDVSNWMNLIKGGSAREINLALESKDKIWARGYWDRYIRNDFHYLNAFNYTIENPRKAFLDKKFNQAPYLWRKDRDENIIITF